MILHDHTAEAIRRFRNFIESEERSLESLDYEDVRRRFKTLVEDLDDCMTINIPIDDRKDHFGGAIRAAEEFLQKIEKSIGKLKRGNMLY